jgi:arylsulfatase A-like enzyme
MGRICRLRRIGRRILSVRFLCASLVIGAMASSAQVLAQAGGDTASQPNILVVIGDDMGVETLEHYGIGSQTPTTATLDMLADRGVRFSTMWAQPVCSSTRATILTGRYGFRTGVGGPTGDGAARGFILEPLPVPAGVVEFGGMAGGMGMGGGAPGGMGMGAGGTRWGITLDEYTLTQALETHSSTAYNKAAIGKWHLADVRNGWQDHPNLVGFDHFSGLVRCCVESYFSWIKLVNGEYSQQTGYAVSDKVDDAISWYDERSDDTDPWLLWLAFNTPHTPIHMPPRHLLQSDHSDIELDDLLQDQTLYFDAMIEAMDTEIGRLLDHIGPDELENTYVLFIGDNGTGSNVVREPFQPGKAKGSVYNGGVAVPFIVTGPGVAEGKVSDALVNSTDLFATILEMAGMDIDQSIPDGVVLDSVSMMPYLSNPERPSIRDTIYADSFTTTLGVKSGTYAMRGEQYKFLVDQGVEHFFDLGADPYEHVNLLEGELTDAQRNEFESLRNRVDAMHASEQP